MLIALCSTTAVEFHQALGLMQNEYPQHTLGVYLKSPRWEATSLNRRWLLKPSSSHSKRQVLVLGGIHHPQQAALIRQRKGHLWHWKPRPSSQIQALPEEPWVSFDNNDPNHLQEVFNRLLFAKGFLTQAKGCLHLKTPLKGLLP